MVKGAVEIVSKVQKKRNLDLRCPTIIKSNLYVNATLDTIKFFCRDSSIHGLRYIVDSDSDDRQIKHQYNSKYSKALTKLIFSVGFMMLAGGCLFMMSLVYGRYKTNPTTTSIETTHYPIYKVPFPAVTFCNINKVYLPAIHNFTDELLETGIDKSQIDDFFQKLFALLNPEYIEGIYLKIYIILESLGYDSEKLMKELAQPCNNMLKMCFWLGMEIPCYKLFRVVESNQGFCCSFNYHGTDEYFSFFGNGSIIKQSSSYLNGPNLLYVTGARRSVGLSVLLDAEPDEYVSVTKSYYGIDVFIHDSEEQPDIVTKVAQPGQDVAIPITPSVTVSEANIRDLPIEQRHCYFEDERQLRSLRKYSFLSCMAECKVDTILELCGCIPFFYPETKLKFFGRYIRQCSLRDVNCLRLNRLIYNSLAIAEINDGTGNRSTGMECKCYPTCSDRQYATEAVIGQHSNAKLTTAMFGNISLTNLTSVHVYFQDLYCIKYRRNVYLTWDTLLSQFGGIFGLCLGGSIFSIIEFIYTFTFKYWFYTKSNRKPKAKRYSTNSVFPQRRRNHHILNFSLYPNNQTNPFLYGN